MQSLNNLHVIYLNQKKNFHQNVSWHQSWISFSRLRANLSMFSCLPCFLPRGQTTLLILQQKFCGKASNWELNLSSEKLEQHLVKYLLLAAKFFGSRFFWEKNLQAKVLMKIRLNAFLRSEPFLTKTRVAFISQERSFEKDLFSGLLIMTQTRKKVGLLRMNRFHLAFHKMFHFCREAFLSVAWNRLNLIKGWNRLWLETSKMRLNTSQN